jgi:chemotaxis protein histidine kinase CheA/CheY-like chemotaxis protein
MSADDRKTNPHGEPQEPQNRDAPPSSSSDWVRDEIALTLDNALKQLACTPPQFGTATQLLQQALRALAVAGLEAERHFLQAAEQLLSGMDNDEIEADEAQTNLVMAALEQLSAALAARAQGFPCLPLEWLPLYRELRTACGQTMRASDLFYPDLTHCPAPAQTKTPYVPDHLLAQQAQFEHARFERGLKVWLRSPASHSGVADMRRAVHAIELSQRLPAARAFWWAVSALFDTLEEGSCDISPELLHLIQSVERQIRHLLTGSVRVPEDLMREVLYHLAVSPSTLPRVLAVRDTYHLSALVPASVPLAGQAVPQLGKIAADLPAALAGDAAASQRCCEAMETLLDETADHPSMDLVHLLVQCRNVLSALSPPSAQHGPDSPLWEEMHNTLDALGRAFYSAGQNSVELRHQASLLAARLAELEFSRAANQPLEATIAPDAEAPRVIDEAHAERDDLLAQLAKHFEQFETGLQASLSQPLDSTTLQALTTPLRRMDEILARLGATLPRDLLATCTRAVNTLIEMGSEAKDAVLPVLAQSISELDDEITSLCRAPQAEQTTAPTPSASDLAQAPAPAPAAPAPDETTATDAHTFERVLRESRAALDLARARLQTWQADAACGEPSGALLQLVRLVERGAKELQTPELIERARATLAALEASPPSVFACLEAVRELAQTLDEVAHTYTPRPAHPTLPSSAANPTRPAPKAPRQQVRVPPLSDLLTAPEPRARLSPGTEDATEIAIVSAQLAGELQRLRESLAELQMHANTMAGQVRTLLSATPQTAELNVHEALNMLSESAQDLVTLQQSMARRLSRTESLVKSHARRQRTLHQSLLDLHNVPANRLGAPLQRLVSQLAEQAGVPGQLHFESDDTSISPTLCGNLTSLLEDLLLQMAEPLKSARPPALDMTLRVSSKADVLSLALQPLHASATLDLIALRDALENLPVRGAVEATRLPGGEAGDTLHITLPLPSATMAAVVVSSGPIRTAIPSYLVCHRQILEGLTLTLARESGRFFWLGEAFELRDLPEFFGEAPLSLRRAAVLLLRAGEERLALICDAHIEDCELLLKSAPSALFRVPGMLGATLRGDNEVLLLVDPLTLAACMPRSESAEELEQGMMRRRVLLVDEAQTPLTPARAALESAGLEVVSAATQDQLLDRARTSDFAAAVIDSDAPGMDGLELARRLRADPAPAVSSLPILMLSSRRSARHREAARLAGADQYLVKPCEPEMLITALTTALGAQTPGSKAVDAVPAGDSTV